MTATQTGPATGENAFAEAEVTFAELEDALKTVGCAINPRSRVPVLGGVRIELNPDGITLAGFDGDVSVRLHLRTTVGARAVVDNTTTVVKHAELAKVLAAMGPGKAKKPRQDMSVRLCIDDTGYLAVSADGNTMPVTPLPLEDYPSLPDTPATAATVNRAEFTDALTRTAVARGGDEKAFPMLIGVHLTPDELGGIRVECTDRFRLTRAHVTANGSPESVTALPPATRLVELCKHLSGETLHLGLLADGPNVAENGPPLLTLTCGHVQITIRNLAAEFPKTDQLMPAEAEYSVTTERRALLQRIETCGDLAKAKTKRDEINLTTTATGISVAPFVPEEQHRVSVPETPATTTDVPDRPVSVRAAYLRDALKNFASDAVTVHFQGATRPMVITETPNGLDRPEEYRHLIMPIRPSG